jgi:hypothetical protein
VIGGDGDRIVGFYRDFESPFGEGFLWTPTGGMVDLAALSFANEPAPTTQHGLPNAPK